MQIQVIDTNTFRLNWRGNEMTLQKVGPDHWEMATSNASSRAWNRGYPSVRRFATLDEVEAHYKSWKGIKAFVEGEALG